MIIPFFITHAGCPHQCVFCNQKNIVGQYEPETPAAVSHKIDAYLGQHSSPESVYVAFYGGTFTALPLEMQNSYLESVMPFIRDGRVRSTRVSTRPDCLSREKIQFLKAGHVAVVELGIQSMDDRVLELSGRGHTAEDARNAVALLKEFGMGVGLQLMPGLPGDSEVLFSETVDKVLQLKPDAVRLYPAVVIKGTPLEELYLARRYIPLTLEQAVAVCRDALAKFRRAGIPVIRMGLQPCVELETPGTVLDGPFHPAFGQLVESALFLENMRIEVRSREKYVGNTAVFLVHPRDISTATGQRRSNIDALRKEFGFQAVRIRGDCVVPAGGTPILLSVS